MTTVDSVAVLARLAEDQWGLVTHSQALQAAISRTALARIVDAGVLERLAHGVYRLRGGEPARLVELRAAWLGLDPRRPAWQRAGVGDGVVSHRSAAQLLALGDLIADIHEFTVTSRRQTRRPDIRIHVRRLTAEEWSVVDGLPVTRPSRLVADLLAAHEDPSAVATIAAEALRRRLEDPQSMASAVAPYASWHGLPRADGRAMLDHLITAAGAEDRLDLLTAPDPTATEGSPWTPKARTRTIHSS